MSFISKLKAKTLVNKGNRVALALGGGGARGYAHIGALKAFEEEGISFDICAGTSVGSIIGALYCAGLSATELVEQGESLNLKEIHNGVIIAPNDPFKIGRVVTNIIGEANIEDLPKKFAAVAVDLTEGKQIVLDKGNVGFACSASSCVPLFFRPVVDRAKHLVDGGILNNIPSDVCRMLGADKVVSIDVNPTRGSGTSELSVIDVIKASLSLMIANSSLMGIRNTDVLIAPDMSKFSATSKTGYEEMIKLGYDAAKMQIKSIKELF